MKLRIENSIVIEMNGKRATLGQGEYEFDSADGFIQFIEGLGGQTKQPYIKDEKIRKAVRAWAGLYDYKFVTHRFYTTTTGHRWSLLARESQEICLPDLDGLEESKDYTIAELCGEEEE